MGYDVVIVGAGPVGASLACGLCHAGVSSALVEARPPAAPGAAGGDARPIALALGSKRILETLGAWQRVGAQATPIRRIHVSDRGHFGFTRLAAVDHEVEALGYVVGADMLGRTLEALLASQSGLMLVRPAEVQAVVLEGSSVRVELQTAGERRCVRARLVVVADGGRSRVRRALGIGVRTHSYHQVAVVARVTPEQAHRHTAYERFTDTGPLALLPMGGRDCGLVWSVGPGEGERLLALDDAGFLEALQRCFGRRLGAFREVRGRGLHPLELVRSREQVRSRVAVIGNAAHQLHPVAGQGLNLGLRDAAALTEVVAGALRAGEDPGALTTLERYAAWRHGDQRAVTWFTDALARLFSNDLQPLALGRDLGLLALDLVPPLKNGLAWRAMGLAGRQSRLARGLRP